MSTAQRADATRADGARDGAVAGSADEADGVRHAGPPVDADGTAPADELIDAMWTLIGAVRRLKARQPSGEGELGTSELRVLGQLGALGGPTPTGELGRLVGLNPASTSGTVDRLESAGLVSRTRDVDDRRVVRVELTDEGRDAVGRRVAAWRAEWAEALAALPPDDLEVTARTLRAVARVADGR